MKKWLQNLSATVIASLLAVTVSGKAYANSEEPPALPSDSPTEIVAPAASAPAQAAPAEAPVVADSGPVSVDVPALEAPVAKEEAGFIPVDSAGTETVLVVPETALAEDPNPAPDNQGHETGSSSETDVSAAEDKETVLVSSQTDGDTAASEPQADAGIATVAALPSAVPPDSAELPVEKFDVESIPNTPDGKASKNVTSGISVLEKDGLQLTAGTTELNGLQPAEEKNNDLETTLPESEIIAEPEKLSAPLKSVNLLSVPGNTVMTEAREGALPEQSVEPVKEENEAPVLLGTAANSSALQPGEGGNYVLVNNQDGGSITADGDITVLAAGLNHIASISVPDTGTVSIAGTGILLVDSLEGNVQLLTLTDIYEEGSVALFVKDDEGRYVLRNGTVPGILDEDYLIENTELVMPDKTSLLLCGTGAEPIKDENGTVTSVNYYHGTDHDYENHYVVFKNVFEHVGKLTIAEKAALVVQKGAAVLLENLKSLSSRNGIFDVTYPELIVNNGGELTVDGSVNGGGSITIDGENSVLSGSGSMSASVIAMDATTLNSSDVSLSNAELHIRNTEPIQDLKITDCTLIPERIVTTGTSGNATLEDSQKHLKIKGLETTGNCSVDLPAGSDLVLKSVYGTLTLKTRYEPDYQVYFDKLYDENDVIISVSGNVGGSGEIHFENGYFAIEPGTRLNNVEVQMDGGYHVYDYTGKLGSSLFPLLCVDPMKMISADNNTGEIPVAVAMYSFDDKTKIVKLEEQHSSLAEEQGYPALIVSTNENGVRALTSAQLATILRSYIEKAAKYNAAGASVEFLRKNSDGRLTTGNQYSYLELQELNTSIPMGDVCLIRIKCTPQISIVMPVTASTQTGTDFTGSGILGGSGAGSVSLGNAAQIVITNGDTENDTGTDNSAAPKPAQLAATVEEVPEKTALVWAEDAPGMNTNADASTEAQYVVLAVEGEKTLKELGGKAAVSMNYSIPAEYAGKTLYVVFRNEDGSLTAIRATYSNITGLLRFITDRLGTFMLVGFDFDGKEFSEEFYAALAQLDVLKDLVFAEYSPV